jgi:hypothetical protein
VLRSNYHSGLCGMFNVASRGEELLTLVITASHRMQSPFSASQNHSWPSLTKASMSSFPPLVE